MDWLQTHLDLIRPETWATASIALAVVATNATWVILRFLRRRGSLSRLSRSSGMQAAAWLIVALYLLLPPLLAWRYGAISPYLLGMAELDWIRGLGSGGLLVALLMALVVFGWLAYRHTLTADQVPAPANRGRFLHAFRAPIDAALAQWHLAFYRAAVIVWIAAIPPIPSPVPGQLLQAVQLQALYWGSWLGVVLLLTEAALNPFIWAVLRSPTREECAQGAPEAILRKLAVTIATTVLFILTRNFWLCVGCQIAIDTAIAGWLPLYRFGEKAEA